MLRTVSFAMCLFAAAAVYGEGPLRWKLDKGEQFVVTSSLETIQTADSGKGKIEMPVTFTFTTQWTVTEAKSDVYKIDQLIKRIQLAIKYPGFDIAFDSEKEAGGAAEQLGKVLRPLVGTTVTQTLTARGEVREVNVPDSLFEKFAKNPMTKKMMSKESVKGIFSQANVLLPQGAVEKGESWESEAGVTTGLGHVDGKQAYTYAGPETVDGRKLQRLDVTTTIEAGSVKNPLGGKVAVSEAKGTGKILFDSDAGHLVSSTSEHTMSSKLELFGKEFVQEMKATATTTIVPGTFASKESAAEE